MQSAYRRQHTRGHRGLPWNSWSCPCLAGREPVVTNTRSRGKASVALQLWSMRLSRFALLPAGLAFALAPQALADAPAQLQLDGALAVQADKLEVDVLAGEAVLTGNVTLTKGDLKVACPRIDLRFDTMPHVVWARGSGGVTADVRGVHAEGPEAELDLAKQILELRGGVRLSRGQGWLQADQARIEVTTGKVTATQVKGSIPVPPRGP
jgi:lipopolysaccharide export system protein LptA